MTSEPETRPPVDYIHVLRRHGFVVAVISLICAAAAVGVSVIQKRTYSAEASISVSDPNQALSLLGGTASTTQTPAQLAAAYLPKVARPEVAQRVAARLHFRYSASQLTQMVTARVDPSSDLVLIDAKAPTAADAAAIANGFARVNAARSNLEARQTFASAARSLAQKIRALGAVSTSTTRLIYVDQLSRLQSLSVVAAPVQLSALAQVPGSPSSPKPLRNAIIGVLLGIVLGLGAVYARQFLDRRFRNPQEIEEHMGLPLVGAVRNEALGRAGTFSNGSDALESIDLESFRILRQNVEFLDLDRRTRCIVVTSPVAEEGKSTVAAGLAMASAALGRLTLLLECDLRRPVLAERFGLEASPGLTDYLAGTASPEQVTQVVAAFEPAASLAPNGSNRLNGSGTDGQGLVCITAGTASAQPAELLGSIGFQTVLSELQQAYEVIILDSSPLLLVADTLELVPHVSDVVLCVRCDQTTWEEAKAARASLSRLPPKPVGVVATGLRPRTAGYYRDGYSAYVTSGHK